MHITNLAHAQGAFDWVAQELEFSSDFARAALCNTFLSVINAGHGKATRALRLAWATGVRWPSGEAYLHTKGWHLENESGDDTAVEYDGPDPSELLYERMIHVTSRIMRNSQIREILDPTSARHDPTYTHALLNKHGDLFGDPCNFGINKIISSHEALQIIERPAHDHPACRCTVDPFPITSEDRKRLTEEGLFVPSSK